MNSTGVVVIGRNEGDRLATCLASLAPLAVPVVYVDSGSTDGSVELARKRGAEVISLSDSTPFSAARARNSGFDYLMDLYPNMRFVQFIDGDCELLGQWLNRAARELEARPTVAVVCGRRRERFPEKSFYNRLADLEWETPVGEVKSCGGDAMFRAEAFKAVGGFEASIAAGEEPELCRRLRAKKWTILRMNLDMTLHDSAMLRFGQWWRRGIRSGYGALDVETRFPATDPAAGPGPFARQIFSTRIWGFGWPAATLLAMLLTRWTIGHAAGWIVFTLFALAMPGQIGRIAWRIRDRHSPADSVRFACMILLNKFAHICGQAWYLRDRMIGRGSRLIEYKQVGSATSATPVQFTLFANSGNAIMRWLFGSEFAADLARYPRRPFWREQSVWAVMIYRFGRHNDQRRPGPIRFIGNAIYWPAYRVAETLLGITLPKAAEVGPGLRIYHFGTIVIHQHAKLGARCTIRHGVTIGSRREKGPAPVLEDGVNLGAFAQILGDIRIGRGASIGAMAVVLKDVPPGATAVGNPARIILPHERLAAAA
ncbi:MAG TPA: glycosyltransferase [Tepidisphaeraceae bacterium]|jgi:serine acetyltransferase/glycosyltransferase involved in cell wall biosynthesis|nr:glycosyltransferase [Tepidisphaeraceae bacterium]